MKVSEMFPSKYLKGVDLQGKAWRLTIVGVAAERMSPGQGRPEEEKFILHFQETPKGVILSRTTAYQIAVALDTENVAEWVGRTVTIYPESMTVGGQEHIGIRARKAESQPTKEVGA